jgi:beta-N-acetylhexosaminidase
MVPVEPKPGQELGQHLLLAFVGKQVPPEIRTAIAKYRPAGFTLFRSFNIDGPSQVLGLTTSLQEAAKAEGLPPLLIAADQEGGQLMAIGDGATPLPGNMALGAAGSADLARRAGEVLGTELAALGINVNYAPSCDVNLNPRNPVIGVRSFGENPAEVGRLGAALIEGMQSAGIAATAKHFPGHGDTASDSHHGLPTLPHDLARLRAVEIPPFVAAIEAGVKMILTAHVALPALDGPDAPPATLSRSVLTGLLREQLGFGGVIVTDALDMGAIRQGDQLGAEAARAIQAGADLLLMKELPEDHRRVYEGLAEAVRMGQIDTALLSDSLRRIQALRQWLSGRPVPPLEVVGCARHQAVADEIAAASMTLVRDRAQLLPLRLKPSDRLAVVLPRPLNLTPADTSSFVTPALAAALRLHHGAVDEYILPHAPTPEDLAGLLPRLPEYAAVIVGTLNAFQQPAQAALVREALKVNPRTIIAALRLPYDLVAFPEAPTYVCAYGILEPSMRALAAALFGRAGFPGSLPVTIPDLPAD